MHNIFNECIYTTFYEENAKIILMIKYNYIGFKGGTKAMLSVPMYPHFPHIAYNMLIFYLSLGKGSLMLNA